MRMIFRYAVVLLFGLWGASVALGQPDQTDQRWRTSLAELERLNLVIESARQSNDPAKMRAAIDELQNSLAKVRADLQAASPAPAPADPSQMNMEGMDHSKMNMPGMNPPPKSPSTSGTKPSGETPMDHSHMNMPGMSSAPTKPPVKSSAASSQMSVEQPPTPAMAKDPVCGMEVETKSAEKATYQGKTYYFCSRADKEKFLGDPEKYVKR